MPTAMQARVIDANPGNYRAKFASVNNGDTVRLANGTYSINDTDIRNITRRSGVTYTGDKYKTIFDNPGSQVKQIKVDSKSNVNFTGITWNNFQLYFRNCNDHRMNWSKVVCWRTPGSSVDLFGVYLGARGKTEYVAGTQTANDWKQKGIKYIAHRDCLIRKNDIRGKLRGAYDLSSANNITCVDNRGERAGGGPTGFNTEDHGVYHHDIYNLVHHRNTVMGWSNSSSGGSVKVKNVTRADVYQNNYYTSGVLGRVEHSSGAQFRDIWIRNNDIRQGDINIWTPGLNPTQVRIESNNVRTGQIAATRDVTNTFNYRLGVAGNREGGVYNNRASSYSLASVVKRSGNQ